MPAAYPRPWIKPELIVLARCHAEETVLNMCKAASNFGPDANDCGDDANLLNAQCYACQEISTS